MRFGVLLLILPLSCGSAWALSIDGEARLHATVGQPLNVVLPLIGAEGESAKLRVSVEPSASQPRNEHEAATEVTAEYVETASGPAVHLSSQSRITVPAISLHLEVSAGAVTVARDLSVLFDVPDLYARSSFGTPEASRGIAIRRDEKLGLSAGDAAANGPVPALAAGTTGVSSRYQVRSGDTLPKIAAHLAASYPAGADALSLAIYEANLHAFKPGDPQHPIYSRELGIPNPIQVNEEPEDRIEAFKKYLRNPIGSWALPSHPHAIAAGSDPPTAADRRHRLMLLAAAGLALLVLVPLLFAFARGILHPFRALRRLRRYQDMEPAAPVTLAIPPVPKAPPPASVEPEPVAEQVFEPEPANLAINEPSEPVELARLRYMLQINPDRADIRLRLVRRLYDLHRAERFAEIALPLQPVLPPQAWENVRVMAHELLPQDPRFQPLPVG